MNLLESELRYSTLFLNAKATNVGEYADLTDFDRKIGCHGNALQRWEKEGRVHNLRSYTYLPHGENLLQILPVVLAIIGLQGIIDK